MGRGSIIRVINNETVIGITVFIGLLFYPQAYRAYETSSSMLCPRDEAGQLLSRNNEDVTREGS